MVNTPIPHSLKSEAKKAAKILREFTMVSAKSGPDKLIPAGILAKAKGLAILTVFKAGFLVTARGGSGIVIAKIDHYDTSEWSAPSAIGLAGLGGGFEIGAEVTDFVIILNSRAAVDAFSKRGNLTLGGNFTIAAGPLGRNVEGDVAVRSPAAIYTYSKTKGLFAGISIEGTGLIERKDANRKFYGAELTAQQILSGEVRQPPECSALYDVLETHQRMAVELALRLAKKEALKHQDKIEERAAAELNSRYGIPADKWRSKSKSSKSEKSKRSSFMSKMSTKSSSSKPPRSQSAWVLSEASHSPGPLSSSGSSSVRRSQALELASELGPGSRTNHQKPAYHGSFQNLHDEKASRRLSMPSPSYAGVHYDSDDDDVFVIADYDFDSELSCDLSFRAGDKLRVLTQTGTQDDWWEAVDHFGNQGIFPANFVHLVH